MCQVSLVVKYKKISRRQKSMKSFQAGKEKLGISIFKAVILLLFVVAPIVCEVFFCFGSLFGVVVVVGLSSLAIILLRKRELVASL